MIIFIAPYSLEPSFAAMGAVRKMETIIYVLSDFGDIILVNSAHNETGWYHRDVRKRKIGRTTVLEYLPRRWPGRKPGKFLNLFEIGSIIRDILYQYGKPQILWLYNPYAFEACFAIKLSRLHSCPVVLELEDAPLARKRGLNPKPWLDNLAYKRLLPCVDYAFCVNKVLAACLEEHKIKTFLLPGLLAQSFLEKIQKRSPFAGQKITIGYFGQLSEEKGARVILGAAKTVNNEFRWIITGAGPLEKDFQKLTLSRPDTLSFYGRVSEEKLAYLISSCDVIINPHTPIEKMGNGVFPFKVIEAVASGRLLLSTSLPDLGVDSIFKSIVFFDGSVRELMAKLNRARQLYQERREMIRKAQKYIADNYTESALYNHIRNIIEML